MFLIQKPFLSFLRLLPHKPFFPSWVYELTLLSFLLFKEAIYHFFEGGKNWNISGILHLCSLPTMPLWKCRSSPKITMLDLPELTIECILEKLSPSELCKMSSVCSHLREMCTSDHLWKRHMEGKWSRVIGEAAWNKWELQVASKRDLDQTGGVFSKDSLWHLSWFKRKMEDGRKQRSISPVGSLFSFYQVLESGRFSFPAQVYNRENGNAGFLLSCYDAEISYKPRTNMFYARYPPHGKRVPAIEEVPWERVRAHVGTFAHDLHISDCLSELSPGDHIEIQWRRSKELPYGWWYGVVGHLEACEGRENGCYCLSSDTIVLEFNHHPLGSRWRKKIINRKEHREEENEEGFHGGIRRVQNKEEISVWKQFCPAEFQD